MRWAWVFKMGLFIGYYNNWNGFNDNKNASFFFVSIETPYRFIGFLLKTPARPNYIGQIFLNQWCPVTWETNVQLINYTQPKIVLVLFGIF